MAYKTITVTLTPDTAILASGDIIADTQIIAGVARSGGDAVQLQSITLVDEDDQGAALDIYILSTSASLGTENSAPNISDANARNVEAVIPVATGDYKDLGGVRVVNLGNLWKVLQTVGGRDLYVAVVNGAGTPTYTASGLKLKLGFDI
jgi:hypothetical protein